MNNYVMIPVVAQEPDMLQNVETETDIINQQKNVIYVPIASYDNYGIVKIGSGFSYENGVLNVGVGYSIRFTTSQVDYSVSDNVELDKASIEPSYGIQVGDFVESINENSYGVVSKIVNVDENIVTLEYVYDKPDAVLYVAQNRTEEEKNFARQNINALEKINGNDFSKIETELSDAKNFNISRYTDDTLVDTINIDTSEYNIDTFKHITENNTSSFKNKILKNNGVEVVLSPQIIDCIITPNEWIEVTDTSVFGYSVVVNLNNIDIHTRSNKIMKSIELYNDNPKLFAKYGFAISEWIDINRVTILAVEKPNDIVSLKIGVTIV